MSGRRSLTPLFSAVAFGLTLTIASAQAPSPPIDAAAIESCKATPNPSCVAEMALAAALNEPEGWAITAAYESLLQYDPDPAKRELWLKRYEEWAASSTIDGIKERISPVRAEFLTRKGEFDAAYKELGLDKATPDGLSDPTTLLLDEARAGRVNEALARIEQMVEAEARDDLRSELIEIALERAPASADVVVNAIKDRFKKRLAQTALSGARGEVDIVAKNVADWMKAAKSNLQSPFDDADVLQHEVWDIFLRGAIAAKNIDAFRAGLAKRPVFNNSNDIDAAGRLVRSLMRDGRVDWIEFLVAGFKFAPDESIIADEDASPLRAMPTATLLNIAKAASGSAATAGPVTDIIVELLATRGDVAEARKLFIEAGRIAELNRIAYDQERISVVFETLWRAMAGRESQTVLDDVTATITSKEAKAYIERIAILKTRMNEIASGTVKEQPGEDEWAIMTEMAQAGGDYGFMLRLAGAIQEPGLKATAMVQIVRLMWDKGVK